MDKDPADIGGLQVDGLLGAGGMGRVYLCTDAGLSRQVAVKTLLPALLSDLTMRERFTREARALARVKSPHVVAVYSVGDDPVVGPFVVMERLTGEDVLARLHRGEAFSVDEACTIVLAVLRGVGDAHAAGVLHRDIKPANIFLKTSERGGAEVVLTDFGLAKETATPGAEQPDVAAPGTTSALSPSQLTKANVVVGTPAYLAPELARGQPASPASDLYAVGATFFHLLASRPPFVGDNPIDVLTQAVLNDAPRVSTVRADVPAAVDDLVATLLAKNPTHRPTDAGLVIERLQRAMTSLTETKSPGATASAAASTTQFLGSLATGEDGALTGPTLAAPNPSVAPDAAPSPPSPPERGATSPNLSSMPKGTAVKTAAYTVMMTDIAGYTERTGRQSRDEAARWLTLHDTLLQPLFRAFSGKVVKTIGDAFLVAFTSPTDAVHCGMAIQDRLFLHNADAVVDDKINVRIALSAGEVRVRGILGMGGDIFGEPVNLAARLEGLAEAGEVLISDGVYATMNQAEVKTASRGTHTFKGISRTVGVYTVVPLGEPGTPPFSQTTLRRVAASSFDAVADGARAIAPAMQGTIDKVRSVSANVVGRYGSGLKSAALAGVAVVVIVVIVVGLGRVLLGHGRRERIAHGEAALVQSEIEAIPTGKRVVNDDVDLGLALIAQEKRDSGLAAFDRALKSGSTDDDIVTATLATMEFRDADASAGVLAQWTGSIDDRLRVMLDADWWPRHHALKALEARNTATDDDRQRVGLLDVTADDCSSRRYGLLLLKRAGHDDTALAAVRKLGSAMASNLCMALDIKPAEDAIRRRKR